VLLGNVDVGVAPTRPQKWSTQSAMIVTPVSKTTDFSCVHIKNFLNRFLSRVGRIYLKIERSQNNSLVSKFGKTIKISKTKTTNAKQA